MPLPAAPPPPDRRFPYGLTLRLNRPPPPLRVALPNSPDRRFPPPDRPQPDPVTAAASLTAAAASMRAARSLLRHWVKLNCTAAASLAVCHPTCRLAVEAFDKMHTLSGQKKSKKRAKPGPDGDLSIKKAADTEIVHEPDCEYDMNEPTMGEKLASLSLLGDVKSNHTSKEEASSEMKPPSADSVYILLKQALHAEDHALLLNCLYTRDEKVITNSISMLNPSDVLSLLESLISMIHSRGAVLICCLPWLRGLLAQHASSIMSQESSLSTLNSLYQLIDARISTFGTALQLSTCLDYIFAGIPDDDDDDEDNVVPPVIYEDKDSDDDEAEDTMESDNENEENGAVIDSPHGSEGPDIMSDDH